MSWRERRLITILTTILLILTAAVLIALGIRYRESRDATEANGPAGDIASGPVTDPQAPVALSYDNGATSLSFLREEEGAWRWEADRDFPLDDTVIRDILALMAAWSPQQTLSGAEALERSGLDEPTASIRVTSLAGDTTSLLFGKTTDDGQSHYVRRNADESTVYIIAGDLFELMEVPIYDMCVLPELPALREEDIRSVTIQGAAPAVAEGEAAVSGPMTVLTSQRAQSGDAPVWRRDGADASDDPSVPALMEDLTALSFTRCVDYRPSDEAVSICGFDAPTAQVRILYTAQDNTEQTLRLTIGAVLPDGSGHYVRLDEDTTIYHLDAQLLDALLSLVAQAPEG